MATTANKKAPSKVRVVSTRVPADLWRAIKTHCAKTGKTVQEFVVANLRRGVKS